MVTNYRASILRKSCPSEILFRIPGVPLRLKWEISCRRSANAIIIMPNKHSFYDALNLLRRSRRELRCQQSIVFPCKTSLFLGWFYLLSLAGLELL